MTKDGMCDRCYPDLLPRSGPKYTASVRAFGAIPTLVFALGLFSTPQVRGDQAWLQVDRESLTAYCRQAGVRKALAILDALGRYGLEAASDMGAAGRLPVRFLDAPDIAFALPALVKACCALTKKATRPPLEFYRADMRVMQPVKGRRRPSPVRVADALRPLDDEQAAILSALDRLVESLGFRASYKCSSLNRGEWRGSYKSSKLGKMNHERLSCTLRVGRRASRSLLRRREALSGGHHPAIRDAGDAGIPGRAGLWLQALPGAELGLQNPLHLCLPGGRIGRGFVPVLEGRLARRQPGHFLHVRRRCRARASRFRGPRLRAQVVVKEQGRDNEALFRGRIEESIRRGMPVLGYGVIGPSEPSIVAGYDEGGDVLIGWSFFQDASTELEPSGHYRKRNWFKDTECLLIIGEKVDKPSLEDTCRTALQWMLQVTRTPTVRPEPDAPEWYQHRHNGLAAYEAWAEHLLRDGEWPAGDEAVLRDHHQIHNDAVGTVAEARWYGSVFLAQVVEGFAAGPGKRGTQAEALHAAACYAAEHDLTWEVWELAGGIGNPEAYHAMADPGVRRAMADIVRQARDQDAQAAEHIERALGPLAHA